jgi:hypothetical protein
MGVAVAAVALGGLQRAPRTTVVADKALDGFVMEAYSSINPDEADTWFDD